MQGDVLLGMILGVAVGMSIATYCRGAQDVVKKSGEIITDSTKNLLNKVKGE